MVLLLSCNIGDQHAQEGKPQQQQRLHADIQESSQNTDNNNNNNNDGDDNDDDNHNVDNNKKGKKQQQQAAEINRGGDTRRWQQKWQWN